MAMRCPGTVLVILAAGLLWGGAAALGRAQAPSAPAPSVTALTPAGDAVLQPERIRAIMRRAADYQLAHMRPQPDNDWIRATLFTGILAAYRTTGDAKYLDAALTWAKEQGNWTPPRDRRHADALCCGQVYTELYLLKKDPRMLAPIRAAIDQMMATPKPGRADWSWCDALYMAPPVLPRLYRATGDAKYLRFLDTMYWDTKDFLYDPSERLFFRDAGYFNKTAKNGKKVFWSRGNGWVMGGLVRILEELPKSDPRYNDFVKLHQDMAARLASLQGPDGLWRASLLDPAEFPNPETSGSAFDTYAMAWGINHGTLEAATFLPVARKGWKGLVAALNDEGRLGWVQQVAAAPGPATEAGTQEYAVGAFLLAGSEIIKLAPGQ